MMPIVDNLQWKLPWRVLSHPADIPGLQLQLERELASGHPLWGKDAHVIGRRVDCDDIVVSCNDETLATVHLDWATGPHTVPSNYPSTTPNLSLHHFQQVMDSDALEYEK